MRISYGYWLTCYYTCGVAPLCSEWNAQIGCRERLWSVRVRGEWKGVEAVSLGGGGGREDGLCVVFCCVGYVFMIRSNTGLCTSAYVSSICSFCVVRLCM
jgi:hypothetical protein